MNTNYIVHIGWLKIKNISLPKKKKNYSEKLNWFLFIL